MVYQSMPPVLVHDYLLNSPVGGDDDLLVEGLLKRDQQLRNNKKKNMKVRNEIHGL